MKSERLPRANVPFATMVEQSRAPPVFLPEMPTQGWSADWGGSLCYPKSFQTIFIGTRQQLALDAVRPKGNLSPVRFGSKADMCSAIAAVRFVPIADMAGKYCRPQSGV